MKTVHALESLWRDMRRSPTQGRLSTGLDFLPLDPRAPVC